MNKMMNSPVFAEKLGCGMFLFVAILALLTSVAFVYLLYAVATWLLTH